MASRMKKLVCMLLAAITVATAVPTETVFATNTDNAGETTAENAEVFVICAQIEQEIAELEDDEKAMFLEDLGVSTSGLDRLVKEAYDLLGLATFFTAGEKECRAWTFRKGMKAPQCAGVIHTDFERGFIKAETMSYDDFIKYGSSQAVKEAGRVRQEGL